MDQFSKKQISFVNRSFGLKLSKAILFLPLCFSTYKLRAESQPTFTFASDK